MDDRIQSLLAEWQLRATRLQWCHFATENKLRARNHWIGIPSIFMSVVAGSTGIIGGVQEAPAQNLAQRSAVLIVLASLAAAVLTSLQTFLKLEERANQHNQAARLYGAIKLRIQTLLAMGASDLEAQVEALKEQLLEIEASVPAIPPEIWAMRDKLSIDDVFADRVRQTQNAIRSPGRMEQPHPAPPGSGL